MLTLKCSMAVQVNYQLTVRDQNNTVKQTAVIGTGSLLKDGLKRLGRSDSFNTVTLGLSDVSNDKVLNRCAIPVFSKDLSKAQRFNDQRYEESTKTLVIRSLVTLTIPVDSFAKTPLLLKEISIDNFARSKIIDVSANVNGLNVVPGDVITLSVGFVYTFVTNNNIETLELQSTATPVTYTAKVLPLPGYNRSDFNPFNGFTQSDLKIRNILTPLTGDTFTLPDSDLIQRTKADLSDRDYRFDVSVTNYTKTQTKVYGFALTSERLGVAVLVKLGIPITVGSERRFATSGFIKWGAALEDLNSGFNDVDAGSFVEGLAGTAGITEYTIDRPLYGNDFAVRVTALSGLRLNADNETVSAPTNASLGQMVSAYSQGGYGVTLYTNRTPDRQYSKLSFVTPSLTVKDAIQPTLSGVSTTQPILPIIQTTANYVESQASNSWLVVNYFPWFGVQKDYVGYAVSAITSASQDLVDLSDYGYGDRTVVEQTTNSLSGQSGMGDTTVITVDQLNQSKIASQGAQLIKFSAVAPSVIDPTATNSGYVVGYNSDFDTGDFEHWVPGSTTISLSFRYLDLTTTVTADEPDLVKKLTVSQVTGLHNADESDLYIGGNKLGRLDQVNPANLLNTYGLKLTRSTGNGNLYVFEKPYNNALPQFTDVAVVANDRAAFTGRDAGYLQIDSGVNGIRIYDRLGGELSSSLYGGNNAFYAFGVRVFQDLPPYAFTTRFLSAAEASIYFNQPVATTLSSNLFTIAFEQSILSVSFTGELDSQDPALNGAFLYPAIGFNLGQIDDTIPANEVLFVDRNGNSWTKQALLNEPLINPGRVINNVLYFAYAVRLTEGSNRLDAVLDSSFYGNSISLAVTTSVVVTYRLTGAAVGEPVSDNQGGTTLAPLTLVAGTFKVADFTYSPPQAVVQSTQWQTLDPSIATVDETGRVTAVSPGSTVLRLTLNQSVIASTTITVTPDSLVISCADAPNASNCLEITGNALDLSINEIATASNVNDSDLIDSIQTDGTLKVVNCTGLTKPGDTPVTETAFFDIDPEGQYDLYVGGTFYGKNIPGNEVLAILQSDPRLVVKTS